MPDSYHLIHAHSSVVTEGNPKLPQPSRIEYGEIAVNFAEGYETISIKNSNNDIVTFPNETKVFNPINKLNTIVGNAEIPNFDTTTPYSVGDYTFYNDKLYKCIEAHTGEWNANHFTETTLYEEIEQLGESANEQINVILQREGEDSPAFDETIAYGIGDYTHYNDLLYRFTAQHHNSWNINDVQQVYPNFDSADDYAIGDVVVYNNALYTFISAHTAGNVWDINEVEVVDTFVNTKAYAIGKMVYYENDLYEFTTAHTANTEWDDSEVTLVAEQFQNTQTYQIDDVTLYDMIPYKFVNIHYAGRAWDIADVQEMPSRTGVSVIFNVEGEEQPRKVLTDANGKASTIVTKGLLVEIEASGISGYYTPQTVNVRASLSQRNVYIPYVLDRSNLYESVYFTFGYADPTNPNKATSFTVYYDEIAHIIPIANDKAEFNVPNGKQYTVVFNDVDVYRTPGTIMWTATHVTRQHSVYYEDNTVGLSWIKYDGTQVPLNSVTSYDNPQIAGMLVYTSACKPFIIPKEAHVGGGNWLSQNVLVPSLGNYGSHAAALSDTDGEENTRVIEQFIADKLEEGTTYTSEIVRFSRTVQVTIDNVLKIGFCPSYAQLYQIYLLLPTIRKYFVNIGESFPDVSSGGWWSSTQCTAIYGVYLTNGRFTYGHKSGNISFLPVLAF